MSFESPKAKHEDYNRFSGSSGSPTKTPIREKFKSIISKASHRSSTQSYNSHKSFEVVPAKPSNLVIQTDINDKSKRESTSTVSETSTSTEFNSTSPLPPGSIMDAEDDYEYYRHYYNYHQQQHQGATSHIIENLENSDSSKEFQDTTHSSQQSVSNISTSAILTSPPYETKKRNLIDEPITEESKASSVTSVYSEARSQQAQQPLSAPYSREKRSLSKSSNAKRKSIPPSTMSMSTFNTADSFHSAASDLESMEESQGPSAAGVTAAAAAATAVAPSELMVPGSDTDQRASVNTLTNLYATYANRDSLPPTEAGTTYVTGSEGGDRTSSIYDSKRASTITTSYNQQGYIENEMNEHPLPKIGKNFGSLSTIDLARDKTDNSISEDAKAAIAYAEYGRPIENSPSIKDKKRFSDGSNSDKDFLNSATAAAATVAAASVAAATAGNRNSQLSETPASRRVSQGFYFESEEPIFEDSLTIPMSKAGSIKFPTLTAPAITTGVASTSVSGAMTSGSKNRDTVTTTNSSNYGTVRSSYQQSFANTQVTSPTTTLYNKNMGSSLRNSSQQNAFGFNENKFDTFDKKLQELSTDLDAGDVDIDDEDENMNTRNIQEMQKDDIFVPPYLNNSSHNPSSSFSSLKKSGSAMSATFAAATGAAAAEIAATVSQKSSHKNLPQQSQQQASQAPSAPPPPRQMPAPQNTSSNIKPVTIRSSTNSAVPRPSMAFTIANTNNTMSMGSPFSPLSIQNDTYVKSVNEASARTSQNQIRDSINTQSQSAHRSKLRSFNLKPGNTDHIIYSEKNGYSAHDPFGDSAAQEKSNANLQMNANNYNDDDYPVGYKACSNDRAILLLVVALFVPPLYLIIAAGLLDPSCGYIQRRYKLIAAGMSIFATILSIIGICVGFGVGVA